MPGLRSQLRWNSTGILERIGSDLESVLRFLKSTQSFSVAAAEFLTAVGKVELLQGKLLVVEMDNTTNANYFAHGLGFAYRGAILLGQTAAVSPVTALSAESVKINGQDPTRVFGLRAAVASTARVNAWVF